MPGMETTAEERARWLPQGEVAPDVAAVLRDLDRAIAEIARLRRRMSGDIKLWIWKNSTPEHPHEWWAFDNPFPCRANGDPMTFGEPWGYALLKNSTNKHPEVSESEVLEKIEIAASKRRKQ